MSLIAAVKGRSGRCCGYDSDNGIGNEELAVIAGISVSLKFLVFS